MFAPAGYTLFNEVFQGVENLNYAAITRMKNASLPSSASNADWMVSAGVVADPANARFAGDLMREFLFVRLLELSPPVLTSSSGAVMRVSEDFFIHGDQLHYVYLRWPIDTMPKLSSYFSYSRLNGFNGQSLRERYCFFDANTGLITLKNNSLSLYQSASGRDDAGCDSMFRMAESFRGWSLCWRDEDLPSNYDLVVNTFFDGEERWDWKAFFGEDQKIEGGSHQRVLADLLQAYPNGKVGAWAEVEKKVGYARRTIERALTATGRKDWKEGGGQN